jgi:hypothetical protein
VLQTSTKLGLRLTRSTDDLALLTLPVVGTAGSVLTIIALGELGPLTDDPQFFGGIVVDEKHGQISDLPRVINDMGPMGSLYVVQAAPDAAAIDLVDAHNTKLASGLAYQQASPLIAVPAGESTFTVQLTGGKTLSSPTLRLLPGLSWTLITQGLVAQSSVRVTALPRPAQVSTSWRLVHAVSDGDPWNAANAGKTLVTGLPYGMTTPIIKDVLPEPTLTLIGGSGQGSRYSVAVTDELYDASQTTLATVITTGTMAPPQLAVLAVLDETATAMMAPMVYQLMVTQAAMVAAP